MGITLFDLHFGHIHPIASPPVKKHPELAQMSIKLRYEYGMNSLFYNTLPLKNGSKITKLYCIIQALFLPAKNIILLKEENPANGIFTLATGFLHFINFQSQDYTSQIFQIPHCST